MFLKTNQSSCWSAHEVWRAMFRYSAKQIQRTKVTRIASPSTPVDKRSSSGASVKRTRTTAKWRSRSRSYVLVFSADNRFIVRTLHCRTKTEQSSSARNTRHVPICSFTWVSTNKRSNDLRGIADNRLRCYETKSEFEQQRIHRANCVKYYLYAYHIY